MEALTIINIIIAIGTSATIIYLTVHYGRKSNRLSEEQLELARQQASVAPKVEFLTAYLKPILDEPDLYEEVKEEFESLREHRREL